MEDLRLKVGYLKERLKEELKGWLEGRLKGRFPASKSLYKNLPCLYYPLLTHPRTPHFPSPLGGLKGLKEELEGRLKGGLKVGDLKRRLKGRLKGGGLRGGLR